jgi:sulfide dehydrogenase cytochrome subunit
MAMRRTIAACAAAVAASLPWAALAQASQQELYVKSLASTCANCHGTNGRTVDGSAVPGLAGMPRDYMLLQLKGFRDGSRPATVMHQLTKGYNDRQLEQIAGYFAAQKK